MQLIFHKKHRYKIKKEAYETSCEERNETQKAEAVAEGVWGHKNRYRRILLFLLLGMLWVFLFAAKETAAAQNTAFTEVTEADQIGRASCRERV